jgi:mono/diheme cytochrome c family protein
VFHPWLFFSFFHFPFFPFLHYVRLSQLTPISAFRFPLSAFLLVLAAGCSMNEPPQFHLNLEGRDPQQVHLAQAAAISDALTTLFGTPDEPRVPAGADLNLELLKKAAGPVGGDKLGNRHGLFRQLCVACHGISGDGAGPAAAALDPYPRDFRTGVFKYTSTTAGAPPCREDLRRVLLRGIPGTAMPSQIVLPLEEIDCLVEYVRYLSLRGQAESYLLQEVVDGDGLLPLDMKVVLAEGVLPVARRWTDAEHQIVRPPPPPAADTPEKLSASIAKGRQWFGTKQCQCVKCHGPDGRGDGEEKELYDDWNKLKKGVTIDDTAKLAHRFTLAIERLRPRNFTEGIFHGGARAEDLYLRIHLGIKGTPMPGLGPVPGNSGVLPPEEIWHLVRYIQSLSQPAPRPSGG